ncbi:MAG TPA: glutathione S-transferase family protein [Kofleriaceae bacterium]|nr:glutathione S-transferase family protein [Kofleriaceae bacterium]
MKVYGTPLSHFTRKVRIVLAELGLPFEMVWVRSVLESTPDAYADNPLMRVPALVDGTELVIDSDHIARYLAGRFDPEDRLGVRSERVADLNALAVLDGIMDNEVVLILAKRGGVADLDGITYFRKLSSAIDGGLAWIDERIAPESESFDYRDITLICLWQHLLHYQLVGGLDRYSKIAARVARFAERPSVAASTPQASLEAARAAGWQPA